MPSAFMMGTCMDLGSSLRCIFTDHTFFLLMKHMCTPLSNRATMVSSFNGYTFQIKVTGISISFVPCALSCGTLAFSFSYFLGVSSIFAVFFPSVQSQAYFL